jgi:hypothetical protein
MKKRSVPFLLVVSVALTVCNLSIAALAQDQNIDHSHAIYTRIPPHSYFPVSNGPEVTPLTQWTFTFTYQGTKYSDVFVGTDPSKTNTTTNVPWGIIPIKMVFGASNGNMTFDPNTIYSGNMTATEMINGSILFHSDVDYVQGGTDLGTTQYEDAYQRGDFWEDVKTNTNYHILFPKAVIAPEQTFKVPSSEGSVFINPFGIAGGATVGVANINWFDAQLQTVIAKFPQIKPNTFPIFITYNVYLSGDSGLGGCCIGGYHSANAGPPNGQTYSYATTITQNPKEAVFSQDISALSHEIGEWIMDPFTTNGSPCGILEVGDPLENLANFGDFPYTVNGFTYHPQDLVFIDYFGASTGLTVNGWYTFQNETAANGVCTFGS